MTTPIQQAAIANLVSDLAALTAAIAAIPAATPAAKYALITGSVATGGNITLTEVDDPDALITVSTTTLSITAAGTYLLEFDVVGNVTSSGLGLDPSITALTGTPTVTSASNSGSLGGGNQELKSTKLHARIVTTVTSTFNLAITNGNAGPHKMVGKITKIA